MACRIGREEFQAMVAAEAHALDVRLFAVSQDPSEAPMVEVDGVGKAVVHRKPIQALVDEPEQARPIIRNLLRWAKEHGAQ
jgi:hypothetical protein